MKHGKATDPNAIHPIAGYDKEIYVKPTIQNPNITVGDFTYIADSEFESHVTNFYPWSRDKLIIGKFCQIATGVEFIMNDANHQMSVYLHSRFIRWMAGIWKLLQQRICRSRVIP